MKLPTKASAHSFAHLLGFSAAKPSKEGKRAEDERDDKKDDEEDEDDKKDAKRAKRADAPEKDEKEDDSEEREEDEDDDKKGKKAKSKRARAEDDDDGDDDEDGDDDSDGNDMRKEKARSARLRERARCAAIFADSAAANNPGLAATLAFNTDMPRSQAVAVLRAGGASTPQRISLDSRMRAVKTPNVGTSDPDKPQGAGSKAAQIIAAGQKRRGEI